MDGPPGYPTNPAFAAALKQARERAAGFTRSRQQANAPDPPDSTNENKDGSGTERSGAAGGLGVGGSATSNGASQAPSAAVAAELNAAAAAAAAERMSAERTQLAVAERNANAAMYNRLPGAVPSLHPRLHGMGLSAGTTAGILQLQLSDMHRMAAYEQRQRERELLAAARGPAWAAAAAEERWRINQGLPPLGASPALMAARAAGLGHHHSALGPPSLALSGLSAAAAAGIPRGAESLLPAELRAAEFAERAAALRGEGGGPGVSYPPAEENEDNVSAPVPGANAASAIDLLAAAAEDTLRSEGGQDEKPERRDSDFPPETTTTTTTKPAALPPAPPPSNGGGEVASAAKGKEKEKDKKRKRKKEKDEPKNPLGAFVFYQRKIMADVFEENPCITFGEAAAECGRRWRQLDSEAKEEFRQMAAEDKARYTRELATFKNKSEPDVEGEIENNEVVAAPKAPPAAVAAVAPPKPPKTSGRRKKQDGEEKSKPEPKRPKSALLFFKAEEIPKVMKEYPNVTQKEAATEAAARYKALSKPDKAKYERLAAKDKERYQRELEVKTLGPDASPKACTVVKAPSPPLTPASTPAPAPAPPRQHEKVAPSVRETRSSAEVAKTEKGINGWSAAAVQVPAQLPYEAMKDPHPYYVEEHAWRYHNPPLPPSKGPDGQQKVQQFPFVTHEELRPLPPPPPVPTEFPTTPFCRWSFDEDTRVLHADFRRPAGDVVVTIEDEKFLLEMFERDDITVISEGLVSGLDKEKWTLDYISRVSGDEYYHRFRRFDKQTAADVAAKSKKKNTKKSKTGAPSNDDVTADQFTAVAHAEVDKMLSMKVKDFVTYLRRRGSALTTLHKSTPSEEEKAALCTYSFLDHTGAEHKINVIESALYMLDYDMVKLLPNLYEDFYSCFKLKECLPGGAHCMMNCVNSNGRPFMGPNMYVTPPGSFTHFHQDGHGTVDSGHYCLSGYNEVVMTRRLTERSKRHALRFLTGAYKSKGQTFEGLYDLPHADNLGDKPEWPDNEAIERCNEMNYCVSRFILKEGQCVHINKGRLHAFRKVTNEMLPPNDCHAKLRAELLIPGTNDTVVGPGKPEILCVSVAWDWMYRGVTAKGINREIISILECAALNRKCGAMSLAIPELSLVQLARTLAPKPEERTAPPGAYRESLVGFEDFAAHNYGIATKGFSPSASVICKGIFPALQHVVKQHIHAINVAESLKSKSFERGKRVSVAERPNAWENPVTHPLDPYGNSDFFCKLCSKELSNVYLHCDGCELLLSKDFNICLECHQEKRYATSVQMHPLNNKRHSTINHIGNFTFDRASRCPCKNGPVCRHCNYCAGCSCRCHSWFTLHFRFFQKDDELKLLHRVKRLVGREELDAAEEAEKRLSMAIKGRFSEAGDEGPFGLHNMDVMVDSQFSTENLEEQAEGARGAEAESASDGEPAKLQPKRKSRRLLPPDPTESKPQVSGDGDIVMAEAEEEPTTSYIDRSNKSDYQVGVSDMKVTIRYRSCEWTEQEREILKQALDQPESWESVASKLPDRGIEQIRKFAAATYPALVENLDQHKTENQPMVVTSEGTNLPLPTAIKQEAQEPEAKKDAKSKLFPMDDASPLGQLLQAAAAAVPIKAEGNNDETGRGGEKFDEKKSESNEDTAASSASKMADADKGSAEKLPPANQGRWSEEEKERLRVALTNEMDLVSVERFVGTRRMAAIRSFAPRTFPEIYEKLRERMHASMDKKEQQRRRSSKGDDVATKKPDPDEVIEGQEGPATRRRSSRRVSRKPVEDNHDDKEEMVKAAKAKKVEGEAEEEDDETSNEQYHDAKEEVEHGGDTTEDEEVDEHEDDATSHVSDDDDAPTSKVGVLNRARKQSMRQASQVVSGRTNRRATQDLSGGRKRRNSSISHHSSADSCGDGGGDDTDTSEEYQVC